MYLHLGQNTAVAYKSIVGIFDLDKTTQSRRTRQFLARAEQEKRVINVSDELPKSFIVCRENNETKIYISQLASATLLKRAENAGLDGTAYA